MFNKKLINELNHEIFELKMLVLRISGKIDEIAPIENLREQIKCLKIENEKLLNQNELMNSVLKGFSVRI